MKDIDFLDSLVLVMKDKKYGLNDLGHTENAEILIRKYLDENEKKVSA